MKNCGLGKKIGEKRCEVEREGETERKTKSGIM